MTVFCSIAHPLCDSSDDNYDWGKDPDTLGDIRIKMLQLCIFSPAFGAYQFFGRLVHLCSGHWAWGQAYPEALKTWRIERYINPQSPPDKDELWRRTAKLALLTFADALVKCLTFPLSILLRVGATLIAIGDPLLARHCFGRVEELWSLKLHAQSHDILTSISYQAVCMQPKSTWDAMNWYRFSSKHGEEHWRSRLDCIKNYLQDYPVYFDRDAQNKLKELFSPRLYGQIERKAKKQSIPASLEKLYQAITAFMECSHDLAEADVRSERKEEARRQLLQQALKEYIALSIELES